MGRSREREREKDAAVKEEEEEGGGRRAGGLASVYGNPHQHQQQPWQCGHQQQEQGEGGRDLVQLHSRHRNRSTPPSTPEGFWDLTVPTPEEWRKEKKQKREEKVKEDAEKEDEGEEGEEW